MNWTQRDRAAYWAARDRDQGEAAGVHAERSVCPPTRETGGQWPPTTSDQAGRREPGEEYRGVGGPGLNNERTPEPPMSGHGLFAWYAQGFLDSLGDRLLLFDNTDSGALELLRLRGDLAAVPQFERAVRERAVQVAGFAHDSHAKVRRVDRLPEPGGGLAVISEHAPGTRLSDILAGAAQRRIQFDTQAALALVRQLVDAVTAFQQCGDGIFHGALGPERLVLAPHGRLVVVEYVLGSALACLPWRRAQLWKELRVAVPDELGHPRFGQRTDVIQIGLVALSLLLNRALKSDEYPQRLADLLAEADEGPHGVRGALSESLKIWLARTVQLDGQRSFVSAAQAARALGEIVPARGWDTVSLALEAFLLRYGAARIAGSSAVAPALSATAGSSDAVAFVSGDNGEGARERRREPEQTPHPPERRVFVRRHDRIETHPHRDSSVLSVSATAPTPQPLARPARVWKAAAVVLAAIAVGEGVFIASRLSDRPKTDEGTLIVESQPSGAEVVVDGRLLGTTPIRRSLGAGSHTLELQKDGRRRALRLTMAGGNELSQYIELPEPLREEPAIQGEAPRAVENVPRVVGPPPSWVTFSTPVELWVFEGSRFLGTTRRERIMLEAGSHELDLVNEGLAFRSKKFVRLAPGQGVGVHVDLPRGTLNLNALPWAEVWLDGERVGETPLGDLPVTIGSHEIIFRHPQLGEQRRATTVTLSGPTRLSADLRR